MFFYCLSSPGAEMPFLKKDAIIKPNVSAGESNRKEMV